MPVHHANAVRGRAAGAEAKIGTLGVALKPVQNAKAGHSSP